MTGQIGRIIKDDEVPTEMPTDTGTVIATTGVIPEPTQAEVIVKRYTGVTDTKKIITSLNPDRQ